MENFLGTELNPLFSSRSGIFEPGRASDGVAAVGFVSEQLLLLSVLNTLSCGHSFGRGGGAGYTRDPVCLCRHKRWFV